MEEVDIEVRGVYKRFGDLAALNNVSFNIARNSIFGLLGSNGAGKSTLLHSMMGLISLDRGEIDILGKDIKKHPKVVRTNVAIVPQKISIYSNLTIFDNLYFFGKAYGLSHREVMDRISHLAQLLELGSLNRKVKFLSGGYQRRVSFAIALIGDPKIIILDEALVGIDLETKRLIIGLLNRLKQTKTIIITTHAVDEIESLCDYLCFLHKGEKILEGPTKEILYEYSKKRLNKIIIKFKNSQLIPQVIGDFFEKDSTLNAYSEGDLLVVEFSSDVFNALDLINLVQSKKVYKDSILGVEIKKPGLEDIILSLIKPE